MGTEEYTARVYKSGINCVIYIYEIDTPIAKGEGVKAGIPKIKIRKGNNCSWYRKC